MNNTYFVRELNNNFVSVSSEQVLYSASSEGLRLNNSEQGTVGSGA